MKRHTRRHFEQLKSSFCSSLKMPRAIAREEARENFTENNRKANRINADVYGKKKRNNRHIRDHTSVVYDNFQRLFDVLHALQETVLSVQPTATAILRVESKHNGAMLAKRTWTIWVRLSITAISETGSILRRTFFSFLLSFFLIAVVATDEPISQCFAQ